ncbi:hypothetical protein BR63_18945 [Thermanaerosceptrum fracticalcis]|uniref:Uncharacterized protein n=1 Tax=Thermanaerosceptrum fracticalcis TaxID=1712410 RepID=A0A7G6E7V8_THEFR|nr:hypothetical protein [Thermanaerosceptrum fracticalcis]QNB48162.1 hypothetical protein BR63_18945 [Thermanaerosceptrum fracticalcis]
MENTTAIRKAEIKIKMTEFEFPPMQDVVLIGNRAPIGAEAAKRMIDVLAPDQYEVIRLDHFMFEALVIRKSLLQLIPREKLISIILDEGSLVANEDNMVKAQVNIHVEINRMIDL